LSGACFYCALSVLLMRSTSWPSAQQSMVTVRTNIARLEVVAAAFACGNKSVGAQWRAATDSL
jgi:predicted anti-sigma-YlaC factor YlaD